MNERMIYYLPSLCCRRNTDAPIEHQSLKKGIRLQSPLLASSGHTADKREIHTVLHFRTCLLLQQDTTFPDLFAFLTSRTYSV